MKKESDHLRVIATPGSLTIKKDKTLVEKIYQMKLLVLLLGKRLGQHG